MVLVTVYLQQHDFARFLRGDTCVGYSQEVPGGPLTQVQVPPSAIDDADETTFSNVRGKKFMMLSLHARKDW